MSHEIVSEDKVVVTRYAGPADGSDRRRYQVNVLTDHGWEHTVLTYQQWIALRVAMTWEE